LALRVSIYVESPVPLKQETFMPRPIWKGAINFGLVNVPIELITAVKEKTVHFHMMSKDGNCRLRRKLYCPESGKEYDFNQTARGIEVGPEEYVLIEEREIKRLRPAKGRAMEIEQFVDLEAIDPVFYERVYYVRPGEDANKSYHLLVEAMHRTKKCAIARFVMRDREYLCVLRPLEDGLVLHTLHYADEVVPIADVLPRGVTRTRITNAELNIANELIKSMTKPLELESFKDVYREELEELIDAKVKGKELVHAYDEKEEDEPRTINLMDALKQSLAQKNRPAIKHRRSA
jgi:DNA end-binding protein Ku